LHRRPILTKFGIASGPAATRPGDGKSGSALSVTTLSGGLMKNLPAAALLMAATSSIANAAQHVTCDDIGFAVPAKIGDLPLVDFDYPAQVNIFSFRDGNLLLIAHDQEETSRVRIVISAQLDKKTGSYIGQMIRDYGGEELQLTNGPVTCSVK
jgi:hypothetical protein